MKAAKVLRPGERLDDLIINDLKIIQHKDQFCFSLDAVLLAHFAMVRTRDRIVDLGTGTGVISLLLTMRGAGKVLGVELNSQMAEMAARSVAINGLEEKITIVKADLRKFGELPGAGEWDVVVSNPPYRPVGNGKLNPNDSVACARHEITANLRDVVKAARHLTRWRGRFAMVHLPERTAEILKEMSDQELEPKRMQLVYPSISKKPSMLLVEGVRGSKPGLEVLPPLIVYNQDGSYGEDIVKLYPGVVSLLNSSSAVDNRES